MKELLQEDQLHPLNKNLYTDFILVVRLIIKWMVYFYVEVIFCSLFQKI